MGPGALRGKTMSYLFSTSFRTVGDFLAVNQGTSNIDVLIAATAGVAGTVAGAAITVLGTRVSARAENLRQDRQLASESLKLREALGSLPTARHRNPRLGPHADCGA